jgi:hypothetical protein
LKLNTLQNFCADLVLLLVLNHANASKFMKQFMKVNEYSFQLKMSTITGETNSKRRSVTRRTIEEACETNSIATHYKGE